MLIEVTVLDARGNGAVFWIRVLREALRQRRQIAWLQRREGEQRTAPAVGVRVVQAGSEQGVGLGTAGGNAVRPIAGNPNNVAYWFHHH
jgi:hypothetical protein